MQTHHKHHHDKSARSTGSPESDKEILDFENIPEKAHSVIHGIDPKLVKASIRNTQEYQILQTINQFREKSMFPPLKFKSSLKEYAIDKALCRMPQPETNGLFVVVSAMHFVDVYNGESTEELVRKWIFDQNKLQVLLATGTMANVSFFSENDKVTRIVLLVVSTFSC